VLSVSYENAWNFHDQLPLHSMPPLLRAAFVTAEDKRFQWHRGVDWRARAHALVQNLRARRAVRGASTITEQAARILHPRSRTLPSRWLEGIEATRLEARFSKGEILEFYMNQVPYANRVRGVVQAARHYFDRDLDTLNVREALTLAVLVRSPSALDPRRAREALDERVEQLARRMLRSGRLDADEFARATRSAVQLREPGLSADAPHFVTYLRPRSPQAGGAIRTFIDPSLQTHVASVLERQLQRLAAHGASDGAVLVLDHETDEVLAWVNAGDYFGDAPGSQIDAVVTPRQPGSTLKPFLYALALERGWTAATLIDDEPFARPVGSGLHAFRNYSRRYHGPIRLREALGNSLNVPAVRTAQSLTPAELHRSLRSLGFSSLDRHPEVYGEGLALGNGEVTLLELVTAYSALARGGVLRPPRLAEGTARRTGRRVYSPDVASLIADILADPGARALEFGGSLLDLPVQTAVKTGTSNDYRDAWALGFDHRFTVGVWVGNLDRREMERITGAVGPAVVLRSVFNRLGRGVTPRPLPLSRRLGRHAICRRTGSRPTPHCPRIEEWFRPDRAPLRNCALHGPHVDRRTARAGEVALTRPTPGLQLALDPRIPDALEAFTFEIDPERTPLETLWFVDQQLVGVTGPGVRGFAWHLARGSHTVLAQVRYSDADSPRPTPEVAFHVR
jgi:penicillin-binding protein 1C